MVYMNGLSSEQCGSGIVLLCVSGLHMCWNLCAKTFWLLHQEALTSESSRPTQAARWWQRTGAIVGMSVSAALVLGLAAGAVAYSL